MERVENAALRAENAALRKALDEQRRAFDRGPRRKVILSTNVAETSVTIPGVGVVLTLLVIFVTGVLSRNMLGQGLVRIWESLLSRIPIVRSIYSSVKQVSDTVLSPNGQAFRKALLVQYPRSGVWTIGFQTGTPAHEVRSVVSVEMVSVYVPTTPNPTSGFFLMFPRHETIELEMSVDEALKYIISMGTVAPILQPKSGRNGVRGTT